MSTIDTTNLKCSVFFSVVLTNQVSYAELNHLTLSTVYKES